LPEVNQDVDITSSCGTTALIDGIRVVIADDDRAFRDALAVLIELVPELAVAGKAASAEEAFRLVEATQADACLIDLFMPGMSGEEAVRELRSRHPELVIIVMTGFDDEPTLQAARKAGAEGAMRKHRLLSDVGERLRLIPVDTPASHEEPLGKRRSPT
jgi:DNA-binding NarL/FixJ family response regulator